MAGTDFSHLTDAELLNGIKALKLPDYIRSKSYGADVRETLAQMTEMLMQLAYNQGMDTQQAKDWASQLNRKINKGEVTMSDLAQEVKLALTGGSVAVVDKGAVGEDSLNTNFAEELSTNLIGHKYGHVNDRLDAIEKSVERGVKHLTYDWYFGDIDDATGDLKEAKYAIRTEKFIENDVMVELKGQALCKVYEYRLDGSFVRVARSFKNAGERIVRTAKNRKYKLVVYENGVGTNTFERVYSLVNLFELPKDKSEIKKIDKLPVDRTKFDDEVIELELDPYIDGSTNYAITKEGNGLLGENKGNAMLSFTNMDGIADFTNFSHLEVNFNVKDAIDVKNFSYSLKDLNGIIVYSVDMSDILKEVIEDGERTIRLPFRKHVMKDNFDLSKVVNITFTLQTDYAANITIESVKVIKRKKGVVYMYFDDAEKTQYDVAFPIMKKYGLKGTLAVITRWTDKDDNYINSAQLREMDRAGWVISNHGYRSASLNNLTDEEIEEDFTKSQRIIKSLGFNFGAKTFIAPQTSWSKRVHDIAKKYFILARTYSYKGGNRGDNERTQEFPQNHSLAQYCWIPYYQDTAQTWKTIIDQAIERGEEVSIAWHVFCNENDKPSYLNHAYWSTPEMFDEVCAYIRSKVDEGVLDCVTWEDTMLQTSNTTPIDENGLKYVSTYQDSLALVDLDN